MLLRRFIEGFALHSCSSLRHTIVNLNLQHWVSRQQFCCCLLGGTLLREVIFEVPIDNHRVSGFRRDVSPLNISGLVLFDAESWFLHVSPCFYARRPRPPSRR